MHDDIEHIFQSEIREKKRIGSNIFSRVSTRKGGTRQALKTPYYYMTKKEKKELNGKMTQTNVYDEVLSIDEFNKYDISMKKTMMEKWREKFTNNIISKNLGISRATYFQLINTLDVQRKESAKKYKDISQKQLDKFKNDVIGYDIFKTLSKVQRSELLISYGNSLSPKEIAEIWGVAPHVVYSHNHLAKKIYKNDNNNEEQNKDNGEHMTNHIENYEITNQIVSDDIINEELSKNEDISKTRIAKVYRMVKPEVKEVVEEKQDFYFTINQKGNSESIIKKLNVLIALLESDKNEEYELSLSVKR